MKKSLLIYLLVITLLFIGCGKTNDKEEKIEYDILKGKWIASIENQNVYQTGPNVETNSGIEEYILECDGEGNYTISTQNREFAKGTYSISDDNITVKEDTTNMIISLCKLVDNRELDCSDKSLYAFKYTKIEK